LKRIELAVNLQKQRQTGFRIGVLEFVDELGRQGSNLGSALTDTCPSSVDTVERVLCRRVAAEQTKRLPSHARAASSTDEATFSKLALVHSPASAGDLVKGNSEYRIQACDFDGRRIGTCAPFLQDALRLPWRKFPELLREGVRVPDALKASMASTADAV